MNSPTESHSETAAVQLPVLAAGTMAGIPGLVRQRTPVIFARNRFIPYNCEIALCDMYKTVLDPDMYCI